LGFFAELRKDAKKMIEVQMATTRKLQSGSDTKGKKFDKVS
jgi:hypothetical protein